ncbi:MAG: hypothetical protein AABW51_03140 [Nanoarchaeota archaeon]
MNQTLFKQARENDFFRKKYIDTIPLGENSKYVFSVEYSQHNLSDNKTIAATSSIAPGITLLGVPRIPSVITFYPRAFESEIIEVEHDFLLCFDHELRHAWQKYCHPIAYVTRNKAEKDALSYELQQVRDGKRSPSQTYLDSRIRKLEDLENLSPPGKLG